MVEFKSLKTLTILTLLCVSSLSQAEYDSNLILKSGYYTLKHKDQTIQATPVNFDPDSREFFAIEFEEGRDEKNRAWGTEFINFKNDYAAGTEKITTSLIFINVREYIGHAKRIQPFWGAGVGIGLIDSKLNDRHELILGSNYQLMAGFKFQFKNFIALVEYKNIVDLNLPSGETSTADDRPLISGEGVFAGVGIVF